MGLGNKCAVFVGVIAALVALSPIPTSYYVGGWVRLYTHNPRNFTVAEIPDLTGRVVIVTGGNTGIGKVSVREMARKGAHVILAARSAAKGSQAVQDVLNEVGTDKKVEFMALDLASFASIRAFAAEFLAKNLPLHVLLLNAGVMTCPYATTEEGFEMQIGTNHFGHFLLVQLLQEKLTTSAPSRIVVVSSIAHEGTYEPEGIRFSQFRSDAGYDTIKAYGQSKLANALMGKALARRLEGKGVYVNICHPGWVLTDLARHAKDTLNTYSWVLESLYDAFAEQAALKPDDGALTQLYLSTHPDIEALGIHGQYYEPVGYPKTPSPHALNETLQEALWAYSEAAIREFAPATPPAVAESSGTILVFPPPAEAAVVEASDSIVVDPVEPAV